MSTIRNFRILVILSFLLLTPVMIQAQTDKKAAELKKLDKDNDAASASGENTSAKNQKKK